MQNDNDNKMDLGWIVAFTLVGLFLIFVVLTIPSVQEAACKPDEQDCFRQWVSALGGWAAVAAAIPTIYLLAQQNKSAARSSRLSFVATQLPIHTAATAVIEYVEEAEAAISICNEAKRGAIPAWEMLEKRLVITKDLKSIVHRAQFAEFELRIYHPQGSSGFYIRDLLDELEKLLTPIREAGPAMFDEAQARLCELLADEAFSSVAEYLAAMKAEAQNIASTIEKAADSWG